MSLSGKSEVFKSVIGVKESHFSEAISKEVIFIRCDCIFKDCGSTFYCGGVAAWISASSDAVSGECGGATKFEEAIGEVSVGMFINEDNFISDSGNLEVGSYESEGAIVLSADADFVCCESEMDSRQVGCGHSSEHTVGVSSDSWHHSIDASI